MSKLRSFARLNFRTGQKFWLEQWVKCYKKDILHCNTSLSIWVDDLYQTKCNRFSWWLPTATYKNLLFPSKVRIGQLYKWKTLTHLYILIEDSHCWSIWFAVRMWSRKNGCRGTDSILGIKSAYLSHFYLYMRHESLKRN